MSGPETDAGTSGVADLVRFVLAAQDGSPSRAHVEPDDGWLRVIGSREAQDLVPRVLAELTRQVFRDIEVELSILPPGSLEGTSSAVLDAPMAERLIAAANPVATIRTHVRPWVETRIEAISRRAYVKRYDARSRAVRPPRHATTIRRSMRSLQERGLSSGSIPCRVAASSSPCEVSKPTWTSRFGRCRREARPISSFSCRALRGRRRRPQPGSSPAARS